MKIVQIQLHNKVTYIRHYSLAGKDLTIKSHPGWEKVWNIRASGNRLINSNSVHYILSKEKY